MAALIPLPGLVIRYAWLWRSEAARGQEEGVKDRPCAVVLTAKQEGDKTIVVVAPITHSIPRDMNAAIEIPAAVKARLGLDHERCWIRTNDVNVFTWPGPDIRPANPQKPSEGVAYGYLPRGLAQAAIEGVRRWMRMDPKMAVGRDDPPGTSAMSKSRDDGPEQSRKSRPKP